MEALRAADITLLLKPDKDITSKEPVSPMNVDVKTVNKIQANQIQYCIKRITYCSQLVTTSMQCKVGSTEKSINVIHPNRLKKNTVISTDAEEAFTKFNSHS